MVKDFSTKMILIEVALACVALLTRKIKLGFLAIICNYKSFCDISI